LHHADCRPSRPQWSTEAGDRGEEVLDDKIGRNIGIDYSLGLEYRPFLNNNVIFIVGAAPSAGGASSPSNSFGCSCAASKVSNRWRSAPSAPSLAVGRSRRYKRRKLRISRNLRTKHGD